MLWSYGDDRQTEYRERQRQIRWQLNLDCARLLQMARFFNDLYRWHEDQVQYVSGRYQKDGLNECLFIPAWPESKNPEDKNNRVLLQNRDEISARLILAMDVGLPERSQIVIASWVC